MSDNLEYQFRKGFVNYIDISLALMNLLIIILPLLILSTNIFVSTIGIFLSSISVIILILKFIQNNPLYIYYCFALMVGGLFFLFYLLNFYPLLGALLLPEILYIYTFYSKSATTSQSSIPYDNSIQSYMKYPPVAVNTCKIYKRAKITEKIKKQYDGKTNLKYSFILSVSLIGVFVLQITL
ncbi:MAG: hypothetical protein ACFE9Z_01320 [Promethearchaeota archaeon]